MPRVYSPLANPRTTRETLEAFGLVSKHRLGQNFLVNDAVIGKILSFAEIGEKDTVFEIGPGIGTLTVALLPQAGAVVSVEADRTLEPVLGQTCAEYAERFALVMGDALKVTPEQLMAAVSALDIAGISPEPTMLVANLPYQVAATVILGSFEALPSLRRAVVMVQAEVADRIAASPGSKDYGAYTAKLALFAQVSGRFEVGPGNFMPPPRVNSAVVRIDRRETPTYSDGTPLTSKNLAYCAAVIDAAFAQRRKTIRNSLASQGYAKPALDAAFEELGISPRARAETLAPEQFIHLAQLLEVADV